MGIFFTLLLLEAVRLVTFFLHLATLHLYN